MDFNFDDVYVVGPDPTHAEGSPAVFTEGDRVRVVGTTNTDSDGDLKACRVDDDDAEWEFIFSGDLTLETGELDDECEGTCSVSVSALCAAAVALNADPDLIENLLDLASVIEQFQVAH